MRRAAVVLFVALVDVGCGTAAQFDATSEESAKTSIERLGVGLTEEQKKELSSDIDTIALMDGVKQAFQEGFVPGPKSKLSKTEIFRPLHGLTVAEIHARARVLRREASEDMKAKQAPRVR
jgi:hypothetical protein